MGYLYPMEIVPAKQKYYNIFSKEKFKSVLNYYLREDIQCDRKLADQVLVGALAAVELDCIADMENKELEAELTSQHYLDYVEIANKAICDSKTDREDVREFVDRISKLCYAKFCILNFVFLAFLAKILRHN